MPIIIPLTLPACHRSAHLLTTPHRKQNYPPHLIRPKPTRRHPPAPQKPPSSSLSQQTDRGSFLRKLPRSVCLHAAPIIPQYPKHPTEETHPGLILFQLPSNKQAGELPAEAPLPACRPTPSSPQKKRQTLKISGRHPFFKKKPKNAKKRKIPRFLFYSKTKL